MAYLKGKPRDTYLGGEDFVEEFKRKYKKDISQNKRAVRRRGRPVREQIGPCPPALRPALKLTQQGLDLCTSITRARYEINLDLFR